MPERNQLYMMFGPPLNAKGQEVLLLEVLTLLRLFQYLEIYVQKKLASKCLLYFNKTSEGVIMKE
jgi:hypothetical protein